MTTTVLQNIEVLSTGEKLQPDPYGKPQNVKVVTVLLAPDDAEKLLLASNQGTVQFVLRNASDQAQPTTRPVNVKDLQGLSVQPQCVARRTPAPPKPASVYELRHRWREKRRREVLEAPERSISWNGIDLINDSSWQSRLSCC